MIRSIDINCDMGEGMNTDALLFPFISSANIACGYHAGNEFTFKKTAELCLEYGVAAGAHPSFNDPVHFGRINQTLNENELYDLILSQLIFFEKHATGMGCIMHHVKLHGALYNMAAQDILMSNVIMKAIADFDNQLVVYGLSGSHTVYAAELMALKAANEVFADRTYLPDGNLTPRNQSGALIETPELAWKQVRMMLESKLVSAIDGTLIPVKPDTICLHGDGKNVVEIASFINQHLKLSDIEIKESKPKSTIGLGAAFLMATSAIGPGFITQTTVFTQQLLTSFGFVILISILLDIAAQLNIWRIICVSGYRASELANKVLPGAGTILTILVVLGGVAFNIGNIGGCGLGINTITGLDTQTGAIISCLIALFIFWFKEFGRGMDLFAKILGVFMLLLTLYVAIQSHPPVIAALKHSILPEKINTNAIITLVGGTVGGYISFAGAHRMLETGVKGEANLEIITKSSVMGIIMASAMRILLFFAALGVVSAGVILSSTNPAETVFSTAAGNAGRIIFGLVLWSAAITSVVGAAYTSVSFLRSFHPKIDKNSHLVIMGFILLSAILFLLIQKPPKEILIWVGTLNGFILPVSLGLMLIASHYTRLFGNYNHPWWLRLIGWLVVALMIGFSIQSFL